MKILLIISLAVLMSACGLETKKLDGKYVERGSSGAMVFHGETFDILNGNGVVTDTMKYSIDGNKIKIVGGAFDLSIIDDKTITSPSGYLDKK